MGNSILNKSKYSKNNTDEWYTEYATIEKEIAHYTEQFSGKKILCNCDNPYKSAFVLYFLKNFKQLQLKQLVCLSYAHSLAHKGLSLIVNQVPDTLQSAINLEEALQILQVKVQPLKGNGDFQSEESIAYLKECDILITNPPFSKFIALFKLINKYNKQYLLISNQNAITYKEIFPYIKNNQARVGYHFGEMAFKVPADTEPRKTRYWVDQQGQKYRSLGNAMWLTNLEVQQTQVKLILQNIYREDKYPQYDNFAAIHVQKVKEIPKDYFGIMGVPLTYLKYHNPEDFDIIGEANHGSDNEYDLFKPQVQGKNTFKRILIKRKKHNQINYLEL